MLSHKEKCKQWYEQNKEKRKLTKKTYYENNKESIIIKNQEWYQQNKESQQKYRHERYLKNKDKYIKESILNTNDRRKKNKKILVEYLGGKCVECNYSKYIGALDLHHTDQNNKSFSIGTHMSKNIEKLKLEANKCILLCSNCHRELHGGD